MNIKLSDDEIAQFQKNGVVIVRNMFSKEWLDIVDAAISKNIASPSRADVYVDGEKRGFFQDTNNWTKINELRDFVWKSPAKLIAAQLMQASKVNFLHDHVLVKNSGVQTRTLWHQDQPYSPVDGDDYCTIWLPTDSVSRETSLEFVAGSHLARKWYRPQQFMTGKLREGDDVRWEILPDIEAERDKYEILSWAMEPGDAVVFKGLTLHGSAGNETERDRRVLSTRWTGDDARFQRRSGKMSPPPPEYGAPADGDPLDCDTFPVVWRRD